MKEKTRPGVTIITSTIRPALIKRIFENYARQKWENKQLIIVLNKNSVSIKPYRKLALKYSNVQVFRQPQRKNLGACLNYAASLAKYPYIAKFDDDDYYAPSYIPEAMALFKKSKADVVGKRSCFYYFPHRSLLLHRKTPVRPYNRCRKIAGATIMFHKRVFRRVKFVTNVRQGSDVRFVAACLRKGFRLFTTSSFNFVVFRRANRQSHTWKISARQLIGGKNASIIRTRNFKKHVNRSLDQLKGIRGYHPGRLPAKQDDKLPYGV